ncbi:MAG: YfbU family protein [Devosia indica]
MALSSPRAYVLRIIMIEDAMNLTPYERLTLSMQLRLLAEQDGDETYNQHAAIIENGYSTLYGEVFGTTAEPELPEAVQQDVYEILNMFRALHPGHSAGPDWNPEGEFYMQKFRGFDGNDSGGHYGFARFLIETLGRFEESKGEYNSHSNTLDTYHEMVDRWQALGRPFEMTEEQIKQVIGRS